MYIILSQRKDIEMSYSDSLFSVYHYPAKYKNQIHEGDVFIYYQGDRTNKEHRVYFGTGTVGKILRNSPNPPWQSSIRPLSNQAYNYIITHAGELKKMKSADSEDELKSELKHAIKKYYLDGDTEGLKEAYSIIGDILGKDAYPEQTGLTHCNEDVVAFIDYCKSMKMSYSYKAVLLLALVNTPDLSITISDAVNFFREFYNQRKQNHQRIEKKNCLYQRNDLSDNEIADNIKRNPVRALMNSGYFDYDEAKLIFSVKQKKKKNFTNETCYQKLKAYYIAIR